MPASTLLPLAILAFLTRASALVSQQQGTPGVQYHLRASFADESGIVTGSARIRFQNASSKTIESLPLALGYNAYRPGAHGWPRHQRAQADAIGYQRITNVLVDGASATIEWPASPDSTRARILLPRALAAHDSVILTLDFESRPPALPWRTHRRGRRAELVGWYPLILNETAGSPVVTPMFGTQELEMDIAADQVVGGTGEVFCGDPGWATPSRQCSGAEPGRKRIVWYAEGVSELAYAMSPQFRYEEGDIFEKPVRVLYERGSETRWGARQAAGRTETSLAWTIEIGGRFPWPQITVIEALSPHGQALPMLLLTDDPDQSSILHLVGLMISQQMIKGGEPFITLGAAAFQATWFFETLGRRGDYTRLEREILDWDLDGVARRDEPVARSNTSSPCITTFCRRTEFAQHQLRWWADDDAIVRHVYSMVIDTFLLKPTSPEAFVKASRTLIEPDPSVLFPQLATGATLYDDAVGAIAREQQTDGSWRTTVVIERRDAGRFPQTVWVIAEGDTASARATLLQPQETVVVITRTRPQHVALDPLVESHDWNMLNNRRSFSPGWRARVFGERPIDRYLGGYFNRRSARDRVREGYAPTVWHNDVGGWTYGVLVRQDYLGRFEMNDLLAAFSTRDQHREFHGRIVVRNPVGLRATGWSQSFDLARAEGRVAAGVAWTRRLPYVLADSTVREFGIGLHWLAVTDTSYVDARLYDDASIAELVLRSKLARDRQRSPLSTELTIARGFGDAHYNRFTFTASTRLAVTDVFRIGGRLFAGYADDDVPRQRRIYLAGSDPHEQFGNPFLRSRGSLLLRRDFYHHDPGGANFRALDSHWSGTRALSLNLEVEQALLRSTFRFLSRIAAATFFDAVVANGDLDPDGNRMDSAGAAGIGLRFDQRIGKTQFQTRVDVPVWRSRPAMRRWVFSFVPAF